MRLGALLIPFFLSFFCSTGFASAVPILTSKVLGGSLADVVEPLVPAVVNISVTRYPDANASKKHYENNEDQDELFEWFDRLIRPFASVPKIQRSGSGFLITESGYIVTNNHVIDKADEINVSISGVSPKAFKARVIGVDKMTDLAVLKIDYKGSLPYVKFGDSNLLRVGDPLIVIGNPFGLGGTVTCGIVSNKSRNIDLDSDSNVLGGFIQTDAAINKGNSGGPMFNMSGEVVGVNFAIFSPSGAHAGIGFAIPSSYAKSIVEQLMQKGKIERGALSIHIDNVTEDLADAIGKKNLTGVLVRSVIPDGAGFKAGLKSGDIIIKFADQEITSAQQLRTLVFDCKLNSIVKIGILRNGEGKELTVRITASVNERVALKNHKIDLKGAIEHNGVVFSNEGPSDELSKREKGIVVRRVDAHSQWKMLHRGDRIIAVIGTSEIENIVQWIKLYDQAKSLGRKYLAVLINRKGIVLWMKLPII